MHSASKATEQLWIESPLDTEGTRAGVRETRINNLFSTHPPLEERIAALKAM